MEQQKVGLTAVLGDVLLVLAEWVLPRVVSKLGHVVEQFADVLRPEPPMSVQTREGEVLTGIAVVDRGQVIAFLGMRHPSSSSSPAWRLSPEDEDEMFSGYRYPYGR